MPHASGRVSGRVKAKSTSREVATYFQDVVGSTKSFCGFAAHASHDQCMHPLLLCVSLDSFIASSVTSVVIQNGFSCQCSRACILRQVYTLAGWRRVQLTAPTWHRKFALSFDNAQEYSWSQKGSRFQSLQDADSFFCSIFLPPSIVKLSWIPTLPKKPNPVVPFPDSDLKFVALTV